VFRFQILCDYMWFCISSLHDINSYANRHGITFDCMNHPALLVLTVQAHFWKSERTVSPLPFAPTRTSKGQRVSILGHVIMFTSRHRSWLVWLWFLNICLLSIGLLQVIWLALEYYMYPMRVQIENLSSNIAITNIITGRKRLPWLRHRKEWLSLGATEQRHRENTTVGGIPQPNQ
jgi:hypothetical protein